MKTRAELFIERWFANNYAWLLLPIPGIAIMGIALTILSIMRDWIFRHAALTSCAGKNERL